MFTLHSSFKFHIKFEISKAATTLVGIKHTAKITHSSACDWPSCARFMLNNVTVLEFPLSSYHSHKWTEILYFFYLCVPLMVRMPISSHLCSFFFQQGERYIVSYWGRIGSYNASCGCGKCERCCMNNIN